MGTRILGLAAILTFFLFLPAAALAQQPAAAAPAWDLAITAGSFSGQSGDDPSTRVPPASPDARSLRAGWHHAGEWRLTAGRYWTPHFKTEIEFGATGEGDRYTQRFVTVSGSATSYLSSAQQFIKVREGSARVTWQFLDNQWIHPYLSAGVSVDEERTRTHVYSPVYNPSGRVVSTAERDEPPRTTHRTGVVLGGGAKWYVSPRAFIKTGVQVGLSRPSTSVSFLAGMGFDF